jgi:diaminopimelate epimerase
MITKMEGLGNDFVILDAPVAGVPMDELAKKLCDRHFGVGADGLIIPKPGETLGWYFYNSDGSTAQMCGNGMRCFARYVYDKGLVKKKSFSVETAAGIIKPEILDDNTVRVNMGKPVLQDETTINGFDVFPVSMGNPHCVIFTDGDTLEMVKEYGPGLESHPYFPEKTNVEFVKVLSRTEIEMCVYERGCGITLACGTGACASVAAGVSKGLTDKKVRVNLLGGGVDVEWDRDIFLTGPANYVFEATCCNDFFS